MNNIHEKYMRRVLELAAKGEGKTSPNPMVGALIVKNGKIIAEGYHEAFGGYHAERNAILKLRESAPEESLKDALLYVNLEPCCHHGKTPPCTDIILESGIGTVIVGSKDENEKVKGYGIKILKDAGVQVITGILEEECRELNKIFYHYMEHKRPYVLMKYAMSMDGKIASHTGHSRWISSEESRAHVHRTRNKYSAIMVGIGTVEKDDPMLNCRMEGGKNPIRIVCDSKLGIKLDTQIVKSAGEIPTIIATCSDEREKIKALEQRGLNILQAGPKGGRVDLKELMCKLGVMGIDSLLLEGGSELNYSALRARIVDRVHSYIAAKIIGSDSAKGPVGGEGVEDVNKAFKLIRKRIHLFKDDILIESEVDYSCLQES